MVVFRVIIFAFFLSTIGCTSKPITHTPNTTLSNAEYRLLLTKLLREQKYEGGWILRDVDVSDKFFKVDYTLIDNSHIAFITTASSSSEGSKFIYFESISKIVIAQKGRDFRVNLFDESGGFLYRYVTPVEKSAKLFADAIESAKRFSKESKNQ